MKILLVDDNPLVRKMMREYLPPKASIVECSDGDEAIEMNEQFHPEWILMDLKMGRMDGITASATIHQREPNVKVIIITNYDDEQVRRAAQQAGAYGFIDKKNIHEVRAIFGNGDLLVDTQWSIGVME